MRKIINSVVMASFSFVIHAAEPQFCLEKADNSKRVILTQNILTVDSTYGPDNGHDLKLIVKAGDNTHQLSLFNFGPISLKTSRSTPDRPYALKELCLQGARLSWSDLAAFTQFTNLEKINLDGAILDPIIGVHDARALSFPESVKQLSINNVWVENKKTTNSIYGCVDIYKVFYDFREMRQLQTFSCSGNNALFGEISFEELFTLKHLNLSGSGGVRIKGQLPALETFFYDYNLRSNADFDQVLHFSPRASLTSVCVRCTRNSEGELGFMVKDRQVRLYRLDHEYARLIHPLLCAYKDTGEVFQFVGGSEENPQVLFTVSKQIKEFSLKELMVPEQRKVCEDFVRTLNALSQNKVEDMV